MHTLILNRLNNSTLLLVIIFFNASCRSDISKTVDETPLTQYNQYDTLNRKEPDYRGIITFETYQVLVADGNETLAQIAVRLGMDKENLALYNGLIPNYRPRLKEMIAIPDDQVFISSDWDATINQNSQKKDTSEKQRVSSENNPLRHRVQKGDTVYSLAREYKVSVNSIATWNGLGPDLDIRTGREIIIPASVSTTQVSTTIKKPLNNAPLQKTPPLKTVNKTFPEVAQPKTLAKEKPIASVPEVTHKIKTETNSTKPFIAPVSGKIINQYRQGKGSNNNNGVDYETSIGSPVKVVSDGIVVLVSDIVGGNGKIVLIRHFNEIITIYGRLTNVLITKGEDVRQGQKIGEVIASKETTKGLMHFEVRKGMQSIDPQTMIK